MASCLNGNSWPAAFEPGEIAIVEIWVDARLAPYLVAWRLSFQDCPRGKIYDLTLIIPAASPRTCLCLPGLGDFCCTVVFDPALLFGEIALLKGNRMRADPILPLMILTTSYHEGLLKDVVHSGLETT